MIETRNLTKRFEDCTALKRVDCQIPKGSIYGLVGTNGAGKSTLLRLLTGVYKADEGSVTIEGEDVYENPALKSRIHFAPDELYILPGASLKRMAALHAAACPRFDRKRFETLTEHFRLDAKKPLRGFSKGMRRQAAAILALSCRPDYYFFDETFDGLDPAMRNLVKSLICEDVADRQATAVIASHSLRELEDTCDQLALLHEGGLLLQSDVQDLKTSLFKVQIAFDRAFDQSAFSDIEYLHYEQSVAVAHLIVRGDKEHCLATLRAKNPAVLNLAPLSLEEVFLYEMKQLGYSFGEVLGEDASAAAENGEKEEKEDILHENESI